MPHLAANLSMMFNELPFLNRFEAARKAGFKAVEFLFPYAHPAAEIAQRLRDNGLQLVLFNMPPGNWEAGERGIACLPGRTQEFHNDVHKALEYAHILGCKNLHCMAGITDSAIPFGTHAALYAARVAWAAEQAHKAGAKVLLEPINHRDMPGYFLHTTDQAAEIIAAIGPERVGLQFDIYHCQITEGDLSKRIERLLPIIAHMQLADVPARHEPGTGEINWAHLFQHIDALGYGGWIGCEYRPAGDTIAGLAWRERYGVC